LIADFSGQPLLTDLIAYLAERDYQLFNLYSFAETAVGQALWGDALFVGPALREALTATHGGASTGWASQP
jgi:hypothetical protein